MVPVWAAARRGREADVGAHGDGPGTRKAKREDGEEKAEEEAGSGRGGSGGRAWRSSPKVGTSKGSAEIAKTRRTQRETLRARLEILSFQSLLLAPASNAAASASAAVTTNMGA